MTLSPFYWPDSIQRCMRGKAQGEVVLEIKTNINLSAAHLSHSKMLSNKWQSCGLTLTSHLHYSGLQNRGNELWAFMCVCASLLFCVFIIMLCPDERIQPCTQNCSLNTACSYGVTGQGQVFAFCIHHYIIVTVSSYGSVLEKVCVCVKQPRWDRYSTLGRKVTIVGLFLMN